MRKALKHKSVFEKTMLDSGMGILTEAIGEVRSVALGFWARVGSRDESSESAGMSHFLEHLVFKGTESRSAREISEAFDALGAELNAYTTKEYTCFYCRLLDEHLEAGIEVLADVLQNPLFRDSDIEAERAVVLEEISMYEDSPDDRIHDLLASTILEGHSLGRSILGRVPSLKSFDRAKVNDFYRNGYAPNNMLVAAAGSLGHADIADLIQKYFRQPAREVVKRVRKQASHNRRVKVMAKDTEQAHICLGLPGIEAGHDDRFTLTILDKIFGGGMSSRLFQEVREKRGLAYAIYSYHLFYEGTGLVAVYAGTGPEKAQDVAKIVKSEMARISSEGVTEEELHRTKEHLKGELVLDLENTAHRMARLGQSELAHREILSVDQLIERIDSVTMDDARRVARDIFDPAKLAVAGIGPVKEEDFAFLLRQET